MQVSQKSVVSLLAHLGVPEARSWDAVVLTNKLNAKGIAHYKATDFAIDPSFLPLFLSMVDAKDTGKAIEVLPDMPSKKKKPKVGRPTNKESGRKPAICTDPDLTWGERLEAWKETPYPLTEKGVGVTRTIIALLQHAGDIAVPITKKEIIRKLKKKFPRRQASSLQYSVYNQVPTQLRQLRRIYVWRERVAGKTMGYYIPPPGDGKAIQPGYEDEDLQTVPVKPKTKKTKRKKVKSKAK